MKTNAIMTAVNKMGFKFKKHSPEILAVAGVVGIGVSGVLACKATLKLNDILEETKETVDAIHQVSEDESMSEKYTPEDAQKDLAITYVQTGVKIAKLYAPSVALGLLSVGCLLTSNNILRKRNLALAAAYTALDKGYKEYRGRVVERFGEAVDRELLYNLKSKKITEIEIDEETGKEKKVKQAVEVIEGDASDYSPYARFFDEASRHWEKRAEYNMMFLHAAQDYMNQRLRAYGHLFLNEVYDYLDIPRTEAGNHVGWIYDEDNQIGDPYVDFHIYDARREAARDFVNGYERVILLDFNVVPILHTLPKI